MTEVTCALIVEDNRVLVARRSKNMPHPLKWEFPGGKVKVGESPEKSIKREIMEELGIQIKVEKLLRSVMHYYPGYTIKLIPFVCSITAGSVTLNEHAEYAWVPVEKLRKLDWLEADTKIVEIIERYMQQES